MITNLVNKDFLENAVYFTAYLNISQIEVLAGKIEKVSSVDRDYSAVVGGLVEIYKNAGFDLNKNALAGLQKGIYYTKHPGNLTDELKSDLPVDNNSFAVNVLPELININSVYKVLHSINQLPGLGKEKIELFSFPSVEEVINGKVASKTISFTANLDHYKSVLQRIAEVENQLIQNIDTLNLIPNEKSLLEELNLIPKESIVYLSRGQALSILRKFEIGIMLEKKYLEEIQG